MALNPALKSDAEIAALGRAMDKADRDTVFKNWNSTMYGFPLGGAALGMAAQHFAGNTGVGPMIFGGAMPGAFAGIGAAYLRNISDPNYRKAWKAFRDAKRLREEAGDPYVYKAPQPVKKASRNPEALNLDDDIIQRAMEHQRTVNDAAAKSPGFKDQVFDWWRDTMAEDPQVLQNSIANSGVARTPAWKDSLAGGLGLGSAAFLGAEAFRRAQNLFGKPDDETDMSRRRRSLALGGLGAGLGIGVGALPDATRDRIRDAGFNAVSSVEDAVKSRLRPVGEGLKSLLSRKTASDGAPMTRVDTLFKLAFVEPQPQQDPAAAQQQMAAQDPAAAQQAASVAPPISDPAYLGQDPAAAQQAAPVDPAAAQQMAAPAPEPGTMTPDQIRQLIQQEIQSSTGGAEAGAKPKAKGGAKADMAKMETKINRTEKLLINLNKQLGLPLPYDILDEPESEGQQAQPVAPAPAPQVQQGAVQPIQGLQPAFDIQQPADPTKQASAVSRLLQLVTNK